MDLWQGIIFLNNKTTHITYVLLYVYPVNKPPMCAGGNCDEALDLFNRLKLNYLCSKAEVIISKFVSEMISSLNDTKTTKAHTVMTATRQLRAATCAHLNLITIIL